MPSDALRRDVAGEVAITLSNEMSRPMRIYLRAGSVDLPLGTVPALATRTFLVPRGFTNGASEFQIEARERGAEIGLLTERFTLGSGRVVEVALSRASRPTVTVRPRPTLDPPDGALGSGSSAGPATPPDDGTYLVFRNNTEDEVRVFVYAGERRWFVGSVQAFRWARLHVATDLTTNPGQVVVAAVPVGGRGRNGDPASGSVVLSDSELADRITQFDWTLSGHTLSATPTSHPRRWHPTGSESDSDNRRRARPLR